MRPFSILIGIVLGSSAALLVSLVMTAAIFLLLADEFPARLAGERTPLLLAIGWAAATTALAAAAFVGELRARAWRRWAQAGLAAMLALASWFYLRGQ